MGAQVAGKIVGGREGVGVFAPPLSPTAFDEPEWMGLGIEEDLFLGNGECAGATAHAPALQRDTTARWRSRPCVFRLDFQGAVRTRCAMFFETFTRHWHHDDLGIACV